LKIVHIPKLFDYERKMADKEKYCPKCGWQGEPASDVCPGCLRMGQLMEAPERKKTESVSMPSSAAVQVSA